MAFSPYYYSSYYQTESLCPYEGFWNYANRGAYHLRWQTEIDMKEKSKNKIKK
jgi:hypothetical protein